MTTLNCITKFTENAVSSDTQISIIHHHKTTSKSFQIETKKNALWVNKNEDILEDPHTNYRDIRLTELLCEVTKGYQRSSLLLAEEKFRRLSRQRFPPSCKQWWEAFPHSDVPYSGKWYVTSAVMREKEKREMERQ